jgi:hypothetical protein
MKQLSSKATGFYKRGFPLLWFAFVGVITTVVLVSGALAEMGVIALIVPLSLLILGYFLMKHLLWDLVDSVYDAGDFLLVKNREHEQRVPLHEIMNVSASIAVNPPRITLRLKGESARSPLGAEVSFLPERRYSLNPFAKNPIAEDLILRVDEARSRSAS